MARGRLGCDSYIEMNKIKIESKWKFLETEMTDDVSSYYKVESIDNKVPHRTNGGS
jgi:hypothetical protein